ncbi:hypothetical protein ACHQM5_010822 [Ranunculus cassubicifolius]
MAKSEDNNDLLTKSMAEEIEVVTDPTAAKSDINHEIIETVDKEFQKLVFEENEEHIQNLEDSENPEEIDDNLEQVIEENHRDGWSVDEKEIEKVDGWNLDEVNQNLEGWTAIETADHHPSGENPEETVEVMKGGGKPKKSQFPSRPGEPDCTFYLKTGSCGFGSNCKFNHPSKKKHKVRSLSNESQDSAAAQGVEEKVENPKRVGQLECKYYLTPGGCKFGKVCRYHHPREKNVSSAPAPVSEFNFLGLPIRPGQRECPFYMRTGSCKYATNCRFNHPDPTAGGSEPVYDRSNSAPLHSSSDTQSAISSWPSTDTIPYTNSTQSYMPTMLQPQGMHSSMEWNRYQAPMSPLYPPQGNVSPSMGPVPTDPVDEYPERPGQKECQFYLKTGDCKYKSSCRFHHPKPQAQAQVQFQAQAPMSPSLSPLGLPLRPDQIICTHFSRFGICKYGAACKYDHTPNPNSAAHPVVSGSGPLLYYHNPGPFVRGPMGNGGDGNTGYVQQPV